jgi:hypothetical protein
MFLAILELARSREAGMSCMKNELTITPYRAEVATEHLTAAAKPMPFCLHTVMYPRRTSRYGRTCGLIVAPGPQTNDNLQPVVARQLV